MSDIFTLTEIARALQVAPPSASSTIPISGVSIDSRSVRPGDLFVAISGERFDGNDFVAEAFRKGAHAAIVTRRMDLPHPAMVVPDALSALGRLAKWRRIQLALPIVAITGSAGKTTTKECVAAVLSQVFRVRMGYGNYNNHIGLPLNLLGTKNEDQCLVLEMGANHQGEIKALCELARPSLGVITRVEPAHLEGFGSLEGVYQAKLELADSLAERKGTMVVYGDDPRLVEAARRRGVNLITFGTKATNDFILTDVTSSSEWVCFTVNQSISFRLAGSGHFNALNALAAIAVAHYFKLDLNELAESWQLLPLVNGRFQCFGYAPMDLQIVDDSYNANPKSFAEALQSFSAMAGTRRRWVISGDMLELGEASQRYHRELGTHFGQAGIDQIIGVGPMNAHVLSAYREAYPQGQSIHFESIDGVLPYLLEQLKVGDSILIKGSNGMKLSGLKNALIDALDRQGIETI